MANIRLDDLHRNGYKIYQNTDMFCFGIDAVLLSDFAKANENEVVLDIGTGTGVIPILMEAKTEGRYFIGVDIQKESVELAKQSVLYNNLQDKISIVQGDVRNLLSLYKPSTFDVITCNPPYMSKESGVKNEFTPKTIARHEVLCTLSEITESAGKLLKPHGRFYMVHRPQRLVEIFTELRKNKLEPKQIRLVQPYENKEPNLVLIEAVRGGKPYLKVLPTLIVYDNNGKITKETYDIYYN